MHYPSINSLPVECEIVFYYSYFSIATHNNINVVLFLYWLLFILNEINKNAKYLLFRHINCTAIFIYLNLFIIFLLFLFFIIFFNCIYRPVRMGRQRMQHVRGGI